MTQNGFSLNSRADLLLAQSLHSPAVFGVPDAQVAIGDWNAVPEVPSVDDCEAYEVRLSSS